MEMIREIKNRQLRNALDKAGLQDITLYKNGSCGYFYIYSSCRDLKDDMITACRFSSLPVETWVEEIKELIKQQEQ